MVIKPEDAAAEVNAGWLTNIRSAQKALLNHAGKAFYICQALIQALTCQRVNSVCGVANNDPSILNTETLALAQERSLTSRSNAITIRTSYLPNKNHAIFHIAT